MVSTLITVINCVFLAFLSAKFETLFEKIKHVRPQHNTESEVSTKYEQKKMKLSWKNTRSAVCVEQQLSRETQGGCCVREDKQQQSYVLILPQTLFAVLAVGSAVGEWMRGLRSVLLVCSLTTEKVAGLRWMRKGIVRVDLSAESLIQWSHNTDPDPRF